MKIDKESGGKAIEIKNLSSCDSIKKIYTWLTILMKGGKGATGIPEQSTGSEDMPGKSLDGFPSI